MHLQFEQELNSGERYKATSQQRNARGTPLSEVRWHHDDRPSSKEQYVVWLQKSSIQSASKAHDLLVPVQDQHDEGEV